MDTCEDDKNVKRSKSDDGIIGKLFHNLPRIFERDQTYREFIKSYLCLSYKSQTMHFHILSSFLLMY